MRAWQLFLSGFPTDKSRFRFAKGRVRAETPRMDDPSFRVYRLRSGNRKDAQEIRVIAQKNSTGPEGNRDSRTLKTFFVTDTVAALESSFCRVPLRVFAGDT